MKYEIRKETDQKGFFIRVRSLNKAKHFAIHRTYLKRNDNGETIQHSITEKNCDEIIKSIQQKGITEGFIVLDGKINKTISPEDITHKLQEKEINFTSTGHKLNHHWPIFSKLKDTNYSSIIRATMTLHQVCSSRCQFCSTINRNKKDSITLDEAKDFVRKLYGTKKEISLHEPKFIGNEKKYLNQCIDSTFVSSVGKFVDKFKVDT